MSYAHWLRPEHRQTTRLKRKIALLSQQCGGECYEPQVTSSSSILDSPDSQARRRLARGHTKPSKAALKVQDSSEHYRCLSLALKRDRELMALRIDALRSHGKKAQTHLQPHISLLYAKLNAARRTKMARKIPAESLSRILGCKLQLLIVDGALKKRKLVEQQQLGMKL